MLLPFCDDDGEDTELMPLLVRADVADAPDLFLFKGTVVVVVVAVVAETKEPLMLLVLACCCCWWLMRILCPLRSSSAKETFI